MNDQTSESNVLRRPADNDAELRGFLPNGQSVTRENLENAKDHLLQQLAAEIDPNKLNEGVLRLAGLNGALLKFERIVEAANQVREVRKLYSENQKRIAKQEMNAFQNGCQTIAKAVLNKAGLSHHDSDGWDSPSKFNKSLKKYYPVLFNALSFEDCQRQSDEILSAEIERRDWVEVVKLPAFNSRLFSQMVLGSGEYVSQERY